MGWLILGAALGMIAGLFSAKHFREKRVAKKPVTVAEFWVYTRHPRVPPQNAIVDRMVARSPYVNEESAPIGTREGMLFSDIRLHMAPVLRDKNPHAFRPDLFHESVEVSNEVLEGLADSLGFVRIGYKSETPLPDHRHLQFLPFLAEAVAELMKGQVIYDRHAQKIWTKAEFQELLQENNNVESSRFHLKTAWTQEGAKHRASLLGLSKIGRYDWIADQLDSDQEVLIMDLLRQSADQLWEGAEPPLEVEAFGDTFVVDLEGDLIDDMQPVQIKRRMVR
jgi:hypothetical protein